MTKILIVEDEEKISEFIQLELQHEGFDTVTAQTGREALTIFEEYKPDLILLDIMLPELNGLEVLRRIRKTSMVPVMILTARGETFDRVNGLDTGADDYLPKPFAIEELLARIRALLRRAGGSQSRNSGDILSFQELELDLVRMETRMRGLTIQLTRTEFSMLACLLKNKNHVLSRQTIIAEVWGKEHFIDDNSVDVYIRYLRAKIDDAFGVEYITTVRGAGYTMREPFPSQQ